MGAACDSSVNGTQDASSSREGGEDAASSGGDASGADASGGQDAAAGRDAAEPQDASTADAGLDPIRTTFVYQGGDDGTNGPYPFRTFTLNRETGALVEVGEPVDLGPKPTFIAPSADGKFLYVANEVFNASVTTAEIESDGRPKKLGTRKAVSEDASQNAMVFTSLSPNGRFVLAANYYGPSVAVFPVGTDGNLGALVDSEAFAAPAQSHSVRTDRSGKWAFVPNKDSDTIAQLTFNQETGAIAPNTPAAKSTASGAGPRHIALHPSKDLAYVVNENNSTLTAYRISSAGLLEDIETVSTLPADFAGTNTGAHVLVHPNGRFVYASNRGNDSIAAFSIESDGSLTLLEHESTRGASPRNFDIDSAGELMVVANQSSGTLAVFRLVSDGTLSPLGDLFEGLSGPNAVSIVNVRESAASSSR